MIFMKIEFVQEDENSVKFILRNSSITFANSWRRAMKSYVPTMAVDYIDVYLNTSFLYDEILAHRIGLIPLKTNLEKYNLQEKCVCNGEGCPNCQVSLRLNVEGPKVVYSGDFISEDPEIVPVFEDIPIVELYKDQQLMIEAVARLGTGKEHAKFQPVSVCSYKIIPEIKIEEGRCNLCKRCVEVCPRNVFEIRSEGIRVERILDCSFCLECVKACDEKAITVLETNNFLFTIEGLGQLPIRVVMKKALEVLKEKAEEMNRILGTV